MKNMEEQTSPRSQLMEDVHCWNRAYHYKLLTYHIPPCPKRLHPRAIFFPIAQALLPYHLRLACI